MRECQKERERERGRERDPLPSNGVYRAEATHGECHNKDSDAVRPGVAIRCITCVQLIAAVDHPQVGNLQELVEENEVVVPGRTESAKRRGAGVRSRGNEREDRQEASERRGRSRRRGGEPESGLGGTSEKTDRKRASDGEDLTPGRRRSPPPRTPRSGGPGTRRCCLEGSRWPSFSRYSGRAFERYREREGERHTDVPRFMRFF